MQRQGEVGFAEPLVETRFEHRLGPADSLLGGLADKDNLALPAILMRRQVAGDADEVGHMHVVPAGVHHADHSVTRGILDAHLGSVVQTRRLGDGERVEVGAQQQLFAFAVLQHTDDAETADVCRHLQTSGVEFFRESLGRLALLIREFGMRVKVRVELDQLVQVRLGPLGRFLG